MILVDVLLPLPFNKPFSYSTPAPLEQGQLVHVPFRGKIMVGVVWGPSESHHKGKIKAIDSVSPLPLLPTVTLDFIQWVARYTLAPLGSVLKMVLSSHVTDQKKIKKSFTIEKPDLTRPGPTLSVEQETSAQVIDAAVKHSTFKTFLLDGVTGSGKTEVYLAAMTAALQANRQVLVLLPEIALTTQWLSRFERRFGSAPLQWHSNLTESVRRQTWQAVLKGDASVIVGARSALFLPFPDLGLVIVDEEHDGSYKQEEQVIYNARDMAVVRAKLSNAPIILVSATPSLETMVNVHQNRYEHLQLTQRHGGASLPTIELIDRRQFPKDWITPPLHEAIEKTLAAQEQVMLFLNRRGYAPMTLCVTCGFRFQCPGCTSWLVEHRASQQLKCHHCGYHQRLPKGCPDCKNEDSFIPCGPGVERIHELISRLFPTARCALLTSDLVQSPKQMHDIIHQISNHEIDIIIGTQILAKGHHFPLITLVGVIDGDLGIGGVDLRACERTYQLLHQVAGRAGRESKPGHVLLQTFTPDHPVMQALVAQDRDAFMALEQEQREYFNMPPFGRLAALIVSGLKAEQVDRIAETLAQTAPRLEGCLILGPVPAPLALLRGRHRRRFLIKANKEISIQNLIQHWISHVTIPGTISVTIDIDPYSFL